MRRVLIAVAMTAMVLTGCGDDAETSSSTSEPGAGDTGNDATTTSGDVIEAEGPFIEDLEFHNLEVEARSQVEVQNRDSITHTFSFVGESVSVVLGGGESGHFTAPEAGEYEIFCEIHGSMTATLVVT